MIVDINPDVVNALEMAIKAYGYRRPTTCADCTSQPCQTHAYIIAQQQQFLRSVGR